MRGSAVTSAAGPTMNRRPSSITMPVSEICSAPWAFCSTTSTVRPRPRSPAMVCEDLVLVAGREAERRLVEQQQLRPRLQHHGGLEDLLLAAAEIAGQHAELGGEQRKLRQHPVDRLRPPRRRAA